MTTIEIWVYLKDGSTIDIDGINTPSYTQWDMKKIKRLTILTLQTEKYLDYCESRGLIISIIKWLYKNYRIDIDIMSVIKYPDCKDLYNIWFCFRLCNTLFII